MPAAPKRQSEWCPLRETDRLGRCQAEVIEQLGNVTLPAVKTLALIGVRTSQSGTIDGNHPQAQIGRDVFAEGQQACHPGAGAIEDGASRLPCPIGARLAFAHLLYERQACLLPV